MLSQRDKITLENNVINGGTLKRSNLIRNINVEYIICAKDENGNIVGYAALRKNFCGKNGIYSTNSSI